MGMYYEGLIDRFRSVPPKELVVARRFRQKDLGEDVL